MLLMRRRWTVERAAGVLQVSGEPRAQTENLALGKHFEWSCDALDAVFAFNGRLMKLLQRSRRIGRCGNT